MLDLDHFKSVNDTYGHTAGDLVLQEVARRVESCLRQTDRLARFGGEEIAVLMIELDEDHAAEVTQRVVEVIRDTPFEIGEGIQLPVTVSAGLATLTGAIDSADTLMAEADKALYAAKHEGRDRMVRASHKS